MTASRLAKGKATKANWQRPRARVWHGPFIAIGAIISLLWGDAIIDWYTD